MLLMQCFGQTILQLSLYKSVRKVGGKKKKNFWKKVNFDCVASVAEIEWCSWYLSGSPYFWHHILEKLDFPLYLGLKNGFTKMYYQHQKHIGGIYLSQENVIYKILTMLSLFSENRLLTNQFGFHPGKRCNDGIYRETDYPLS